LIFKRNGNMYLIGNIGHIMVGSTNLQNRANILAGAFGAGIRERRNAAGMTQDELALATGVGRRFLIDLEAGKSSCHLGRSLMVAQALGLRLVDLLKQARIEADPSDELPPP
jgi:DNA-binding XRE family transcriptional regulator